MGVIILSLTEVICCQDIPLLSSSADGQNVLRIERQQGADLATNMMLDSEWLMMNSTAFSPKESYSGTQYTLCLLHACTAI